MFGPAALVCLQSLSLPRARAGLLNIKRHREGSASPGVAVAGPQQQAAQGCVRTLARCGQPSLAVGLPALLE